MKNLNVCLISQNLLTRIKLSEILCKHYSTILILNSVEKSILKNKNNKQTLFVIDEELANIELLNHLNIEKSNLLIIESENKENRRCSNNKDYIKTLYTEELIIEIIETKSNEILDPELDNTISDREREIIKHVAKGLTNKEIADKLFLSPHTVMTHRKNISNKLGIKSISGITVYAILNNIISLEESQI